jgi:hypothetical protein
MSNKFSDFVIPAKPGSILILLVDATATSKWIPACAGMTIECWALNRLSCVTIESDPWWTILQPAA